MYLGQPNNNNTNTNTNTNTTWTQPHGETGCTSLKIQRIKMFQLFKLSQTLKAFL